MVDRFVTSNVRELTQTLVDLFQENPIVLRDAAGQLDPDIGRNLRNRVALYRRDGATDLCFAVYYGAHMPAKARHAVPPTDWSCPGRVDT